MRNPHNDPLSFTPLNVSVTPDLLRGWRSRARGTRRTAPIQSRAIPCFAVRMQRIGSAPVGRDNMSHFPAKFPATGTPAGKIARRLLANRDVRPGASHG
jgi:hypothetical protein